MSTPDFDPFADLPPQLREMLAQLGGLDAILPQIQAMLAGAGAGPVNWDLARRVAMQVAADGDRSPTDAEVERGQQAMSLAEHWLDAGSLPAPPDSGHTVVGRRTDWVDRALTSMRPLVEPVAAATTRALTEIATEQMPQAEELLPEGMAGLLGDLDLGAMMRPMGATLAGMQVGQVVGQLATQLLGQYDLGVPTAGRDHAFHVAVNVSDAVEGWDLDPTEVSIALALYETAHRRLFHAVPWLEAHVHALIAQFANGTRLDAGQMQRFADDLMVGVDPDDPESMQRAMERAGDFRLEPTPEQERVLARVQGVICLVQAWARSEAHRVASDRLPNLDRILEVLRRRRAERGDGEQLLAQLLGLDLKPRDEAVGDRFVAEVTAMHGPDVLQRALAHPENLPDLEELASPDRWIERMAAGDAVPDDVSALFGDLGEAPVEHSADQRLADARRSDEDDGPADPGVGPSDSPGR